jgi:hypothetical protein
MEDLAVTRLWMAGVVAAMAVFGIIAMIGYFRQKNAGDANNSSDSESGGS